jgi:pyruvate/2-oxoglutarate/acetoin dehydrogenase E1 component
VNSVKYYQAITLALQVEMRSDPDVVVIGEDVGHAQGIYAQTKGLVDEFGPARVLDAPDGELGYLGVGVGAALTGLRPVIEISFADFFPVSMDQLVNQAAKIRYMSGGQVAVPLTVLSFGGGAVRAGPQHSGTFEAWLGSMPGLRVATPAVPADVAGLIRTAIRDDNPVVVIMHKALLQLRGDVPDGVPPVPFGAARLCRPGRDVTLVGWSGSVGRCERAAEILAEESIDAEVIDLRSIQPLDVESVLDSVRRTHRLVIAQETTMFCGVGAELAASVISEGFDELDAPIVRVGPPFTPQPYSPPMEDAFLPSAERIADAVRKVVA